MKKSKSYIKNRKGFTLIEVLVAMFCLSFALLLFTGVCSVLKQYPTSSFLSDDVLAIRQLRMILVQSSQITVDQEQISFRYHEKDCILNHHNQRLVKTPGYEIFLKDLKDSRFYEQGGCVYVSWKRSKEQTAVLYCK